MSLNKNSNEGGSDPLPIDAPERRRLPPLLRRAWYSLNQAFRRRIMSLEITPDQFTALRILGEAEGKGLSQRELTELMSSDPNTVASLVERMESNGLIQRKPHEKDRRAHRIKLLAKGRRTYSTAREIAVELQKEILSALPAERREVFLQDLAVVADACRLVAESSTSRRE
jgi:DNA-binding MarR family transcriptional regulator